MKMGEFRWNPEMEAMKIRETDDRQLQEAINTNWEPLVKPESVEKKEEIAEYHELEVVNIRLVKEPSMMSDKLIRNNQDAVDVVMDQMKEFDREVFGVLNISSKGQPINFNVVSVGTLTESLVSPREIFKSCILSNCSGFIAFHCHPSGCPEPSQTDIITTQRMLQAGEIMNIKMVDHIIVGCGTGDSVSFAARGLLEPGIDMQAKFNEQQKVMEAVEGYRPVHMQKQPDARQKRMEDLER